MKAHCLTAASCTCFNLNGYLYAGTGTAPFSSYPLQAWTIQGPPAPPAPPAPPPPVRHCLCRVLPLPSRLRHRLCLVFSTAVGTLPVPYVSPTAVAAKAPPFVAAFQPSPGSMVCTVLALNATLPLHHYKAAFPVSQQ